MSATGLLYSKNPYDLENYHHIQDIAMELLALSGGQTVDELEPLRGPVFDRPTPLVTGDASIFDAAGRLLLIRRADNGLWALPGGALSVGETPAEGVVREAFEETGWRAEVVALMGVWDSRLCGSVTRHQLYHFQFLCRPIEQGVASHAHEVLETAWFLEEELPALENLDPGHRVRVPFAYRFNREPCEAFFDRIGRD
jgi:ADP-ribose pyrophosphatase YjhB (NUDIX family)